MELTAEEFEKKAIETFGDKVFAGPLKMKQENLDKYNEKMNTNLVAEDFENYGSHVWVKENKCPKCDADLVGFWGSFDWDIIHGQGHCTNCNKASFRYYHYIHDQQFRLFELIGF